MKFYSLIFSLGVLVLVGCKSASTTPKTPPKGVITMMGVSSKKAELTEQELQRWSHLDVQKDTIPGMSVDRAYNELLRGKTPTKIIVAVIDSGIDEKHPDLSGRIWINTKEIPNNGIDDDNNGYIDDVHGWNFLGDALYENMEVTRLLKVTPESDPNHKTYKKEFDSKVKELNGQKFQVDMLFNTHKLVSDHLGKADYTLEEVQKILTTQADLGNAKMMMVQILSSNPEFKVEEELGEYKKYVYTRLNYHFNKEFNGRAVVGDNPQDINDRNYGNPVVAGPVIEEAEHGTHVSGIIAQLRGNGLGGDGVAEAVEIMCIRAVPDGDEYDKDIALSIRYAVDNGAKIINGSFGKPYSPNREWVDEAIKYAASKDVLIVHAAGNDSADIDKVGNFPDDNINGVEFANNFLSIGALNHYLDEKLVAPFSNYGKNNVDIFAPGMQIYATYPNNTYKFQQGTSMASPNAAGVAALIRSYYPHLTAAQVKQIMLDSGVSINREVELPGEPFKKVPFASLSKTGKIVNAYNAILEAERVKVKKTK